MEFETFMRPALAVHCLANIIASNWTPSEKVFSKQTFAIP